MATSGRAQNAATLPRAVSLEDGRIVALGDLLDLTQVVLPGLTPTSFLLSGSPAPPLDGASGVRIRIHPERDGEESRIEEIRIEYPEASDYDRIVAALIGLTNQPARVDTIQLQDGYVQVSSSWRNRTTSVWVSKQIAGRQVQVFLYLTDPRHF